MADTTPPDSPAGDRPPLYRRIGSIASKIDRYGVDGLINALGFLVFASAEGLRTLHNGKIQLALLVALGLVVVVIIAAVLGLPNFFTGALALAEGRC